MQKQFRHYLLPILSGIFIGTSYIPFPPWALLFCLAPLWIFWWQESSYKKIFFAGWLTQFFLNAIGFHWIAHTTVEFGRMPWPAGLAVLLLFCSLAHLYYPVAGLLWKWLCRKLNLSQTTSLLILPPLFVLCERSYPTIFYWHLGYPWLWARLPGLQVTEWIGFFGLNLLTLFINALFVLFWLNRKKNQWFQKHSIAAVSLFLIINILGLIQSFFISQPDQKARILMVQGNVGNLEKIQAEVGVAYQHKIVQTFIKLTEEGIKQHGKVDLVVWPETAFPEPISPGIIRRHRREIARLTNQHDFELLTGAYLRKDHYGKMYNSLVLMKGSENLTSYEKTILLAFGEYFPFSTQFPKLKELFPMVSDFGRGPGPTILPWKKANIGAQICYEGLFDEFSTSLKEKGAQIIINITNDSWFGYPFEPYQHMYMTLARSIENRLPLIRVTNTGITTSITHSGRLSEFSPRNKEWTGLIEIPFHSTPPKTFYVKLADKWPLILLLLIGLLIGGDRIARTGKH